ncbi:MAG: HNH endonuclease [Devosia sp.]
MPQRAPRVCSCGKVVPSGVRCQCQVARDKARLQAYDKTRPTAAQRGYDGAWRKLRAAYIAAHPVCEICGKPATDVDHIQPIATHPHLRLEWTNLRALDHACHSRHTALTRGFARNAKRNQRDDD